MPDGEAEPGCSAVLETGGGYAAGGLAWDDFIADGEADTREPDIGTVGEGYEAEGVLDGDFWQEAMLPAISNTSPINHVFFMKMCLLISKTARWGSIVRVSLRRLP